MSEQVQTQNTWRINSALKKYVFKNDLYYSSTCVCVFLVKEKEDLHPDPEVQSAKDETFGEYR